jgi:uncharacterized protein (TIGR03437 family)
LKNLGLSVGVLSLIAGTAAAQPVINSEGYGTVWGIVNAASFATQGLPNAPIAQGSIFAIFGTGLGPTVGVQASSFPLATSLAGVTIAVSQSGAMVAAIPLYVSATQINAILPSGAPLGSDTITVTFNGQSSSPSCSQCSSPTVQVVPASFGILSVNQAGSGQGVFTNGNNQPISYTSPATAGEVLNIWGTGLGAIEGSDTGPPAAGNIGSSSLMVYVGGIEVASIYHGRSPCCSGLDQIQFQVPPDITGCNIPVAVQIGDGIVSNFVSIAIASSDGICSDPDGISTSDLASFAAQGFVSSGYINLARTSQADNGFANFEKFQYANFSLTQLPLQILNFGACSVFTYDSAQTGLNSYFGDSATPTVNSAPGIALDAGPVITINGPNGEKQITPGTAGSGNYGATLGSYYPPSLYLSQGSYTIAGQGGKDVGPFTVSIQMPQPITWTNLGSYSGNPFGFNVVTRADGATVTWSGADPNSYVIISGSSSSQNITIDSGNGAGPGFFGGVAGFNCTAKAADGTFTIPPIVLLALPPSGLLYDNSSVAMPEGSLQVTSALPPVTFSATGLRTAQAISSTSISQAATYQ